MAKCKGCGADIVWIKTANGKNMPCDEAKTTIVTESGETLVGHIPHWATCPQARSFKNGGTQEVQQAEIDITAGAQKPAYDKATAKAIIEKMLGYLGTNQKFIIADEKQAVWVDCEKLFAYIEETAKEYGLEVVE